MPATQIDSSAGNPLHDIATVESGVRPKRTRRKSSRSFAEWWSILPLAYKAFIILISLSVILVLYLYLHKLLKTNSPDIGARTKGEFVPNPSYVLPPSYSNLHVFKNGAVCSDSKECSEIGKQVLNDGGNVVDATLSTLFCNGIATWQSLGIGGGFVMNMFINGKAMTLNAKETAPAALRNESFKTEKDYQMGPLSIATPGEVLGYWELHKNYGSLKWKDLIEPSIKLCENGITLTKHMSDAISPELINDPHLKKSLFDNSTGLPFKAGDHIYPPQSLCDTYKILAERGGEDFYRGQLADLIVEDLKDIGSVITKQDLLDYRTEWSKSIPVQLDNSTMHITPAPTGGAIVALIINILKGYKFSPESIATEEKKVETYHRIIEAFKFAFGQRSTIGDPKFVPLTDLYTNLTSPSFAESLRQKIDDHKAYTDPSHYGAEYEVSKDRGTSHISVIAPNGDAISVTSSINFYFGSGRTGKRTGIIFNSAINDFGIPTLINQFGLSASPANYIKPKKRSLSSMSPIIITDQNNNVQMVVGAAGGTKIITGVSLTIIRTLWFEQNIKQAVDSPRIHHQIEPMVVQYEYGTTKTVVNGLEKLGHKTERMNERGSIVCALFKNATAVYANADFRKAGDVVGLN